MLLISYKEYQNKAIESLVSATADLISKADIENKIIVFQSPTGSGKTYMVSRFMRDFIEDYPDQDVCFLWISIGKGDLHKQSKKSIQKILGSDYRCNVLEEAFFGSRSFIERNELVVANWEKLRAKDKKTGEWSNRLMRESENVSFLEVLENTKRRRKIILIIDESHYASDTGLGLGEVGAFKAQMFNLLQMPNRIPNVQV